jgi:hypothetical protein
MSSINLCDIDDNDLSTPLLASALIDSFKAARARFPESIIVTEAQAKKFFFANNEVMSNFKGIPLQLDQKGSDRAAILNTITGVLSGMHIARVKDVAEVYSMLETMKLKFTEKKTDVQAITVR